METSSLFQGDRKEVVYHGFLVKNLYESGRLFNPRLHFRVFSWRDGYSHWKKDYSYLVKPSIFPIATYGRNVPKPCSRLESLGIDEKGMEVIDPSYEMNSMQKQVIPIISSHRDFIGCFKTGCGKSYSYLIPIMSNLAKNSCSENLNIKTTEVTKPEALVICPTRELAVGLHSLSRRFTHHSSIKSTYVVGGMRFSDQKKKLPGTNFLVGTPGRIIDFTSRSLLDFSNLKYLVFEEFDRLLDMGFRMQLELIISNVAKDPSKRKRFQISVFTSHVDEGILEFCRRYCDPDFLISMFEEEKDLGNNVEAIELEIQDEEKRINFCHEMEEECVEISYFKNNSSSRCMMRISKMFFHL